MGLDITAYRQLTAVPEAAMDDGSPVDYEHYTCFWHNSDFPGREEGIQQRTPYAWEERFDFRAGSYSGYNAWREQLAKLAGYPLGSRPSRWGKEMDEGHAIGAWDATEGPFWELIMFSDCEGTLGAVVAAKLLADFQAYADKAHQKEAWFAQLYDAWTQACTLAADHGAIAFH